MACKTWTFIQMIFTMTPPSDGSYNRRFVSIHFSEEGEGYRRNNRYLKNY
jgi:hypothetical protein